MSVFAQYDAENKYLREPVPITPVSTQTDVINQPVSGQGQGQDRVKSGTGDTAPNGVNSSLIGGNIPSAKVPPNLGPPPPIPPRAKEVQS